MEKHVAVSVLGKDRPGIVAAVTKALFATGCNIEDSSMTSLRNEFAMILIVALPAGTAFTGLQKKMRAAGEALGLTVTLRLLKPEENRQTSGQKRPYIVSVYGADKPGIVYRLSALLAENKVNITDVQTKVLGSHKRPVYVMLLEISLPPKVGLPSLKAKLASIGAELAVSITINTADSSPL